MKEQLIEKLKNNKTTYKIGILLVIIYYNYISDSLRFLRYLCAKLNVCSNKRFKRITKFRNIHKGQRCFIVATGPSLTFEHLALLQNEYCFGLNSIVKVLGDTGWRPTYYGIQDSNVYEKLEDDIIKSDLNTIFVGHRLQNRFASAKSFIPFFHFSCFHGRHGEIVPLTSGFSKNIEQIVYDGYSISYSMLQLAVYMGFKEIYLLGTDCSYDVNGKQHFVESGFFDKQASSVGERMIYAYTHAKRYADKNGIKIYNATRGGMLEVFERVDLENVIQKGGKIKFKYER